MGEGGISYFFPDGSSQESSGCTELWTSHYLKGHRQIGGSSEKRNKNNKAEGTGLEEEIKELNMDNLVQ